MATAQQPRPASERQDVHDDGTSSAGAAPRSPSPVMSSVSGSVSSNSSSLRSRKAKKATGSNSGSQSGNTESPLTSRNGGPDGYGTFADMPTLEPSKATTDPKWIALALFSGAFAAFNGVFAKLTTSENTVSLATSLSHFLTFIDPDLLTILLRAAFFGLNIASNAIMWVLFTRALTSHPSTTKVSVVNTSANFTITAIMGALVFGEAVGGVGGIAGLALLVGGCVVLGAEEKKDKEEVVDGITVADPEAAETLLDGDEVEVEDLIDLDGEQKPVSAKLTTGILEGTESDDELESRASSRHGQ